MDYTFANFVVGSSNRFAYTAALAVAKLPVGAYNPLVIYGGTGLGKTHLLHAIRHAMLQTAPTRQVVYLSAERFSRDLSMALQHHGMEAFRSQYRLIDALLVDDVQFLAGKTHTQEEFFHTFNTLYEAGKQIVLSSDRVPQDITPLPPRLRSRFVCGLLAEVQPPDLDTCCAILMQKAESLRLLLHIEVARLIATHVPANVRQLESCLARLGAYASLQAQSINTALAETVLQQFLREQEQALTAPRIQQTVAAFFGIKTNDLRSKSRLRTITLPRQIAMFLCRELTTASLPEIGRYFGGKDHTTVLHACNRITHLENHDESVARILWHIRQTLGTPCGKPAK
jgi:chromosomal replication initiator protein